jgi:threonine-phosphate decarboxylase
MKKFRHGGDIESFAKDLNCNISEVIDLSSNINFVKPNIKINLNKLDVSFYPSYEKLYNSISKLYNVKVLQCELFNGGSSAIFSLFDTLNLEYCTIYSPAYLEYKRASEIFHYKLKLINRYDNFYKKVKKNSLVIFVNPSTPDGKYYKKYQIKKLFKIWEKAKATVLIDESFLQFYPKAISIVKYIKRYKKLYILKSMTKIYSSAGIRIGAIISRKKNIKALQRTQPMWRLSQFDITYLQEILRDKEFIIKSVKISKKYKLYTKNILINSNLVSKILHSDVNFFLVKLKKLNATKLQEELLPYKIMIRDCSNFDFLNKSYMRIAIKEKSKMKLFKQAMKKINEKY